MATPRRGGARQRFRSDVHRGTVRREVERNQPRLGSGCHRAEHGRDARSPCGVLANPPRLALRSPGAHLTCVARMRGVTDIPAWLAQHLPALALIAVGWTVRVPLLNSEEG